MVKLDGAENQFSGRLSGASRPPVCGLGEKGGLEPMDYHYQQLAAIEPKPELTPDQVVKIQLEGLQNNDLTRDNMGIRICFNFASPGNKIITGPIGNFIKLVKTPSYSLLSVLNGLNLA